MFTNHTHVAHRPILSVIVLACLAVAVLPTISKAAPTVFSNVPYDPDSIFNPAVDANGILLSHNSNNGWDGGRGMQFTMNANQSITSFGVLQDVTRKTLNFEIFDITNSAVLASGSTGNISTSGLEFIDVFFGQIDLLAGNAYHMEFDFTGNSNLNYFYWEGQSPNYTEGAFSDINGTLGGPGGTSNTILPQFRVNTSESTAIPEPAGLAVLGFGLAGLGFVRRRRAN
ncbi:MAG: hypothetical protein ACI9JL_002176 [Paracoccaceae bacterium]|jgi:hypothetical protein